MRKSLAVIMSTLVLLICLGMAGCTKYASSYRAVALIQSNNANAAFMSFYSFDGTKVFRLKGNGKKLVYTAKVEMGGMIISIDIPTQKETQIYSRR